MICNTLTKKWIFRCFALLILGYISGAELCIYLYGEVDCYDMWSLPEDAKKRLGKASVFDIAYSPDEQLIAMASLDDNVSLWNTTTGKHIQTLTGHRGYVLCIAFSPDGHTIATGSNDQTIKLWDVATGKHKWTLTEHKSDVKSIAFSPDNKTLASAGKHSILLWDTKTGRHKQTLIGHTDIVNSVVFSFDGKTIASVGQDGKVFLWNLSVAK